MKELFKYIVQLPCVQVGVMCRMRFVSSKDNGSLGRGNGWSLFSTWFMSDTAVTKTKIKLSTEVRKGFTVLGKHCAILIVSQSLSLFLYTSIKKLSNRIQKLSQVRSSKWAVQFLSFSDRACVFLSSETDFVLHPHSPGVAVPCPCSLVKLTWLPCKTNWYPDVLL